MIPYSRAQMKAWLLEGVSPGFIAQGLKLQRYRQSHIWFLTGPVVQMPESKTPIPNWLRRITYAARLDAVWAEHETDHTDTLATPADVAAWLFASSRSPVIREYVAHETLTHYPLPEVDESPPAKPVLNLGEMATLFALRRDIREQVVRRAREREIITPGAAYSAVAALNTH